MDAQKSLHLDGGFRAAFRRNGTSFILLMINRQIQSSREAVKLIRHLYSLLGINSLNPKTSQKNKLDLNGVEPALKTKFANTPGHDASGNRLPDHPESELWIAVLVTAIVASLITYLAVIVNLLVIDYTFAAYHTHTLTLIATGLLIFVLFEKAMYGYKQFICTFFGNTLDRHFLSIPESWFFPHSIRFFKYQMLNHTSFQAGTYSQIKESITQTISDAFFYSIVGLLAISILLAVNLSFSMILTPLIILIIVGGELISPYIIKTKSMSRGIRVLSRYLFPFFPHPIMAVIFGMLSVIIAMILYRYLTGIRYSENILSLGEWVVFIMLSGKILRGWQKSKRAYSHIQEQFDKLTRLHDDRADPKHAISVDNPKHKGKFQQMTLRKVHVETQTKEIVLKGIDFHISEGDKVWIEGDDQTEKSIFCKLLNARTIPSSGSITINQLNISHVKIEELCQNIALLSLDDVIFNDTILYNISFGKEIDKKHLIRYCHVLELKNISAANSHGLDFFVGENGKNLTVEEKIKVLFLRALMKHTKLLIIDDIFYQLSPGVKTKITCLLNLFPEKTIIVCSKEALPSFSFTHHYLLTQGSLTKN